MVVVLFGVARVAYAAQPPQGISWKEDIQSGKTEAGSRKVPIMMYVAGDNANTETLSKTMQDTRVIRMLRHFVCVFVSQSYNLQKFQMSYVPWIGATPQTTHTPPILIFGDPAGNPRQEYRIEGKGLGPDELLAHLEKVLKALAPEEAKMATDESLKSMTFEEYLKRLKISLDFLKDNLSVDMLVQFQEEVKSALQVCEYLKQKLGKLKNGDDKTRATDSLKAIQNYLQKLAKFKGKEKEKEEYEGYIKKAHEYFDDLSRMIATIESVKETVTVKALPNSAKVSAGEQIKSDIEKLEGVLDVSFEVTDETVEVQKVKHKVIVFRITCEKGKDIKQEIERILAKHGYKANWTQQGK
jgi:hypothetical protein